MSFSETSRSYIRGIKILINTYPAYKWIRKINYMSLEGDMRNKQVKHFKEHALMLILVWGGANIDLPRPRQISL